MGIEASLKVLENSQVELTQKRRAFELALERSRYEAERARRQYEAVDPCNRLVAAELETRWNGTLARLHEAETRLQTELESSASITAKQRERLRALSSDLPAAWNHPSAPIELKKRILRTVIREIVVDVNHVTETIEMQIHWAGGVHTALQIHKNQRGRTGNATDKNVVELIRELARGQTDAAIAATLNRLGYHTGPGNSWNQTRVKNLRLHYQIPVFTRSCSPQWITMVKAAATLSVGVGMIRAMIKQGILPAHQIGKGAPWMIQPDDLNRLEVQNYIRSARAGKPASPQEAHQIQLPNL